jgi:hypothetical protein
MHMRSLTAVSVLAALGLLTGCDAGNDPGATGDTSYSESGDTAPTPGSSDPTMEQTGDQDLAGGGETTSDRTGRVGETGQPTGQVGQTDTGQTGTGMQEDMTGGEMGTTEFAALDTNSDGKLGETEWQPEAVGGMEFETIDEDASGDIDQDEFRQALATTGSGQGQINPEPGLDPSNESGNQ